jgi:hypothetical protein
VILVRTKFLVPTFSCPLDIVMKGFSLISLHPKNYTNLIKFTCLSKDLLPCTVLGLDEVAFPPQKFALSNVRITVSSLTLFESRTRGDEQRRKYSKMEKRAKDKLVRSLTENGGG